MWTYFATVWRRRTLDWEYPFLRCCGPRRRKLPIVRQWRRLAVVEERACRRWVCLSGRKLNVGGDSSMASSVFLPGAMRVGAIKALLAFFQTATTVRTFLRRHFAPPVPEPRRPGPDYPTSCASPCYLAFSAASRLLPTLTAFPNETSLPYALLL